MDNNQLYGENTLKIYLRKTEFTVVPGETAKIQLVLENYRDIPDYLEIRIFGVPANWVVIPKSAFQLTPGEKREIVFAITPPNAPDVRVGKYKFTVQVISQIHRDQILEATGSLIVSAVEATGRIGLLLNNNKFSVVPGGSVNFNFLLVNNGPFPDDFKIAIAGIPIDWVKITPPTIHLAPGEQKEVQVTITVPTAPQVRIGKHAFNIQVISNASPNEFIEIPNVLTIAMYEAAGRIGVLMETVNISVTPGESATFQMIIINRGLKEDVFKLSVDGIPISWVAASASIIPLKPSEEKRITLSIHPPKSSQSRAGRHAFSIQVISQQEAGQMTAIDCTLTVGVFSDFKATLRPEQVEGDEYARVLVENLGNFQQTFSISFLDPNDAVLFEPPQPVSINVLPGEVGVVVFRVAPRTKPLLGGKKTYPFRVQVSSPDNEPQIIRSEVSSQGLIPLWIIPLIMLLCLTLVCVAIFFVGRTKSQTANATKTAEALQTLGVVVTQGAITPSPTWIPATNTLLPSQIPPTNTATLYPGTPTMPFATITPTFTPIPPTATFTWTPPAPTETPPPTPTETAIPADTATPVPDFGPGAIAFTSNRDGNAELYSMDTQNFSIFRLTINPGAEIYAAWSPDHSQIAFSSNQDGNYDIFLMNADGTAIVKLTTSPATDQFPAWSPDGQWIAFSTNRDGNLEIYKIRVDGSELINITNNPAEDTQPYWFTTGGILFGEDRILFTSNRDGNQEIYMMKSDGSDQINLTNAPSNEAYPVGSPDGESVAFTSNRDGNQEIYTMRVDGTQLVNLTNNPAEDLYPAWSPDGRWIAFTTNRDGNSEIYAMKPDGADLYNLTKNHMEDVYPAW